MKAFRILPLALGAAALLPFTAHAVTATKGDMLMGFRVTGGSASFVLNLGQAANYRGATGPITITNINSDLSEMFTPDWATRTDLFWAAIAVPDRNLAYGSDPAATLYLTQTQLTDTVPGTPLSIPSLANRKTIGADYASVLGLSAGSGGFVGSAANATNPNATRQPDTAINAWRKAMAPGGLYTTDFEAGEIEGLPTRTLSLFRYESTASGTQPAATYLGYFKIQEDGSVVYTPAPSALTYSSWASTNVGGAAAGADSDLDGIPNGVEFFTGSNPAAFTAPNAVSGGHIVWSRASGRSVTSVTVQTSTNLSSWTDATANLASGTGPIDFTIPTGQTKLFVRLKVVTP